MPFREGDRIQVCHEGHSANGKFGVVDEIHVSGSVSVILDGAKGNMWFPADWLRRAIVFHTGDRVQVVGPANSSFLGQIGNVARPPSRDGVRIAVVLDDDPSPLIFFPREHLRHATWFHNEQEAEIDEVREKAMEFDKTVTRLTAERDDARKENARLQGVLLERSQDYDNAHARAEDNMAEATKWVTRLEHLQNSYNLAIEVIDEQDALLLALEDKNDLLNSMCARLEGQLAEAQDVLAKILSNDAGAPENSLCRRTFGSETLRRARKLVEGLPQNPRLHPGCPCKGEME